MLLDPDNRQVELELAGKLIPAAACINFHHSMGTHRKIYIKNDVVSVSCKRVFVKHFDEVVRSIVLQISAIMDGQMLFSGQPIQAIFEHPSLRRGEGETILASRTIKTRIVTNEQIGVGLAIGNMAEEFPPLAHALRDFRLATILPPEDGASFFWRSLESILWVLADENISNLSKAEDTRNMKAVADKLSIDVNLFILVKEKVNHQQKFGRHGTKKYFERFQWLKKIYRRDEPPSFFTSQIASNDYGFVDIYPSSFTEAEWEEMWNATHQILMNFLIYLTPYSIASGNFSYAWHFNEAYKQMKSKTI